MLHRTTLGRHALEAFGPSRPNRVACNGCSVSQWDSQTSRGIKDLHMTGPRWGRRQGRGGSVEVPALALADRVTCSSCQMLCSAGLRRRAGTFEQTCCCTSRAAAAVQKDHSSPLSRKSRLEPSVAGPWPRPTANAVWRIGPWPRLWCLLSQRRQWRLLLGAFDFFRHG